jgi:hypothetical protein
MKIGDTIEHEGKTFWLVLEAPNGDSCFACAFFAPQQEGCALQDSRKLRVNGTRVCDVWVKDDLTDVGRFVATEAEYLTLRLKGET